MAKKRAKKAKKTTKRVAKKTVKKVSDKNRVKVVAGRLIFFVVLALISLFLYTVSNTDTYETLFSLLAVLFGLVAIALVIVLLALLFLRILKK